MEPPDEVIALSLSLGMMLGGIGLGFEGTTTVELLLVLFVLGFVFVPALLAPLLVLVLALALLFALEDA